VVEETVGIMAGIVGIMAEIETVTARGRRTH